MSKLHTHYDNLKVARDAPPEVIRAAYKTLCHKFHPDRNSGSQRATQAFQLITQAYVVLSDPDRRAQHDAWITQREAERAPGAHRVTTNASVPNAWDGRERRRRPWSSNGTPSAAQLWEQLSEQVSKPSITITLWLSIGLVGAMLLLFHQS
jgi:DnaJ-class molecular chaperone